MKKRWNFRGINKHLGYVFQLVCPRGERVHNSQATNILKINSIKYINFFSLKQDTTLSACFYFMEVWNQVTIYPPLYLRQKKHQLRRLAVVFLAWGVPFEIKISYRRQARPGSLDFNRMGKKFPERIALGSQNYAGTQTNLQIVLDTQLKIPTWF